MSQCGDALDDRAGHGGRLSLVLPGQEHGELVSAEPERLAALPQAGGDLAQHEIADRMAEVVVDALQVVEVDEAERERGALLLRSDELPLEPFVEAAMVAESGERVGQGEAHGAHRLVRRALVERDRQQRADEGDRERRLALPEDDERQRRRGHEREGRGRLGDVLPGDGEERPPRVGREHGADQDQVDDPVVDEPAEDDSGDEDPDGVAAQVLDREPRRQRREGEHRAVVGDTQRRPALEEMREHRSRCDDHAGRPAEQDDRRDGEDEAERDAAGAHSFHGHRETLG